MIKINAFNNKIILSTNKKMDFEMENILKSNSFNFVLKKYLKEQKKYVFKENISKTASDLTDVFTLLLLFPINKIKTMEQKYYFLLENPKRLYNLIQDLYNFWIKKERYLYLHNSKTIDKNTLLDSLQELNNIILKIYRKLSQNVLNDSFDIYRELNAGVNASLLLNENNWGSNIYDKLNYIDFIDSVIFKPPFMSYTKKNKRTNQFKIINENPITKMNFKKDEWLCFPIYVGFYLTYVYFHQDYLGSAIGLTNLFSHVGKENYLNKKPDLLIVYGGIGEFQDGIYHDIENDIYIGTLKYNDEIDYFGYLKKLILTTNNIKSIDNFNLPLYGSGVSIELFNGVNKNLVLIGDSRAGKSEIIELLRHIGKNYIKDMITIFDDMGTIKNKNNKLLLYGTEIGAFTRLDNLNSGYPYQIFDRAIFTNPNQKNARCIIPVSTYDDITKGYKIDILLYINNHEKFKAIKEITNIDEAKELFIKGRKNNSDIDDDIIEYFNTNPFGAWQLTNETSKIVDSIFNNEHKKEIFIGELFTESDNESDRSKAALEILRLITK